MNKIYKLFLLLMLAPWLWSCSNEDIPQKGVTEHVYKMVFDGSLHGFSLETRATGITFPAGAVMYLQVGDVPGTATYNGKEWTLRTSLDLNGTPSGTCKAYYIEQGSLSGSTFTLTTSSVVYSGVGSYYINDGEQVTVSVTVRPAVARVRFRGQVGTQISVQGLGYYASFDISTCQLQKKNNEILSLTVQSDGFTPYVYSYLAYSDGTLIVNNGNFTYNRMFSGKVMSIGHSGFMDIPTQSEHDGWSTNEKVVLDVVGTDYDDDKDWNQGNPDSLHVSGTDYDDDNDWNQGNPDSLHVSGTDYDDDKDWNQGNPDSLHVSGTDYDEDKDWNLGSSNFDSSDYDDDEDWNPQAAGANGHAYVDLGLSIRPVLP